jgi:hypothetical protein
MIRKLSSLLAPTRPQDRQAPQPRHVRITRAGGEARTRDPVLQAALNSVRPLGPGHGRYPAAVKQVSTLPRLESTGLRRKEAVRNAPGANHGTQANPCHRSMQRLRCGLQRMRSCLPSRARHCRDGPVHRSGHRLRGNVHGGRGRDRPRQYRSVRDMRVVRRPVRPLWPGVWPPRRRALSSLRAGLPALCPGMPQHIALTGWQRTAAKQQEP